MVLKSERGRGFSDVQGYAENRLGPKRTLFLALGAGLGVLGMAAIIHVFRTAEGRG